MSGPRTIESALDLMRLPTLARSLPRQIPPDVLEVMQIAAASPDACRVAEVRTGVPAHVLTEAAQFYLLQLLFRSDADAYHVLGLSPGAPRELARSHLRWLMLWLHPDRNERLEAIYTERVLKAWQQISKFAGNGDRHHCRWSKRRRDLSQSRASAA